MFIGLTKKNDTTAATKVHQVIKIMGWVSTSATIGEIIVLNLAIVLHAPKAVEAISV